VKGTAVPYTLYDSAAGQDKHEQNAGTSVVTGTIVNNCDENGQGKLLVRIPSLDTEVWARMTSPGGGPDAGMQFVHRVNDDVLVALGQNDAADAYILGGLWSTQDQPPVSAAEATEKRVIKSGLVKGGPGHQIEMDDKKQSISIVSMTKQKITIEQTKIELSNSAGTLTITMDNDAQTITVKGTKIKLSGTTSIDLDAPDINVKASKSISIAAGTTCTISGPQAVNIN
jgi:type VI secretion system secreted protein VgrG